MLEIAGGIILAVVILLGAVIVLPFLIPVLSFLFSITVLGAIIASLAGAFGQSVQDGALLVTGVIFVLFGLIFVPIAVKELVPALVKRLEPEKVERLNTIWAYFYTFVVGAFLSLIFTAGLASTIDNVLSLSENTYLFMCMTAYFLCVSIVMFFYHKRRTKKKNNDENVSTED